MPTHLRVATLDGVLWDTSTMHAPMFPRARRAASGVAGAAIAALGAVAAPLPNAAGADGPRGYRIGEQSPRRQVNLCENEAEARELAGIFRKYGVRPGFAALSNAPACARRVAVIIPLEVLEEVVVAPESAESYRISFVLVRIDDGGEDRKVDDEASRPVLVTTRPVTLP